MIGQPLHIGLEDSIAAFDRLYREGYAYAVFDSDREAIFQYTEYDVQAGKELFAAMMTQYADAGNCSLFAFKFYPMPKDGKFIDQKAKCISSTKFRLNELEVIEIDGKPRYPQFYPQSGGKDDYRLFEAIQVVKDLPDKVNEKIETKFNEFELRLKAIEEAEPEEEEESTIGQIGKLLDNPQIAQMIPGLIGAFTSLIQKFIPPQINTIMPKSAVNGTAETPAVSQENAMKPVNEELLNNAVNRLYQHCQVDEDLSLLADFAETQPAMFQMMLANLRAQKKD